MTEKDELQVVTVGDLEWKKDDNCRDLFVDIMTVARTEETIILDFGVVDEDGKKALGEKRVSPNNLHVKHHTRLRFTPLHLIRVIESLKKIVEQEVDKEEKEIK